MPDRIEHKPAAVADHKVTLDEAHAVSIPRHGTRPNDLDDIVAGRPSRVMTIAFDVERSSGPTYMQKSPGTNLAIVINHRPFSLSLLGS